MVFAAINIERSGVYIRVVIDRHTSIGSGAAGQIDELTSVQKPFHGLLPGPDG
jgi:hypothetical protein